jgi:tryptophanyl-tRNA synthetase
MLTDTQRPRREDPGHPENCPVFTYHQLFTEPQRVSEIETECRTAVLSCFDDKKALAEKIIAWGEPIRKRRAELEKEPQYLEEIIRKGNEKAREVAAQTMKEVRETFGFWPTH